MTGTIFELNGTTLTVKPEGELDSMVREGALDGDILSAFKESRAWTKVIAPEEAPEN